MTLTGGTINYSNTSFSDSTNPGYYISSSGIYFGSASDATYIKYDIAGASFTVKGALNAQTGSTLNGTYLVANTVTSAKVNLAARG